jgi:hypothetical protein
MFDQKRSDKHCFTKYLFDPVFHHIVMRCQTPRVCRVCPVNALVKHKCEIPVLQGCLRVSLATHWPEQLVQHLHRDGSIESASAEYSG